jgi:hypothetical protein
MASWQRCDRCRRVLPGLEFDGDATTCRACLATPVGKPAVTRASPVTRSRTTPRPPAAAAAAPAPAGPRPALLGVTGSGDLEVRERRARRAALEALAESHPEEFGLLLRDARLVEGLRPASAAPVAADARPAAEDDGLGPDR